MAIDMITTMNTVSQVMKLEEARARVAAQNIAMANVPGSKVSRFDIHTPMAQLQAALTDASALSQVIHEQDSRAMESWVTQLPESSASLSLDNEVAELSAASGRYQALADGLSRQFALMQLVIRGGR